MSTIIDKNDAQYLRSQLREKGITLIEVAVKAKVSSRTVQTFFDESNSYNAKVESAVQLLILESMIDQGEKFIASQKLLASYLFKSISNEPKSTSDEKENSAAVEV